MTSPATTPPACPVMPFRPLRAWRVAALILALSALGRAWAADRDAPPTPIREVKEEWHGVTVSDPYRWMENSQSPEWKSWIQQQGLHARKTLDRIPGRDSLRDQVAGWAESGPQLGPLQRLPAGKLIFTRIDAGSSGQKLVIKDGLEGAERVLLDTHQLTGEAGAFHIDFMTPSPDGKWLALGLSRHGSENSELRVLDLASGRFGGERIDRAGLNTAITWLPDSKGFFYNRLPGADAQGVKERFNKSVVYLHRLGQPIAQDVAVFGHGVNAKLPFQIADLPELRLSKGAPWMMVRVEHGDARERSFYTAPLARLQGAQTPWLRVIGPEDQVSEARLVGSRLIALSHKDAPRRRVWMRDLARPYLPDQVVMPEGPVALEEFWMNGADELVVRGLDGGLSRLWRVSLKPGGSAVPVPLPFDGLVGQVLPGDGALLARIESWIEPPRWLALQADGSWQDTGLLPAPVRGTSDFVVRRFEVKSHDGTLVPMTVVHRKDLPLRGQAPTILTGYGAYGISREPRFLGARLAWIERGGVWAVAHVRGGGEHGEAWHHGAWVPGGNKMNSVLDFIACAEELMRQNLTRPSRLGGIGGSAGGILIGDAITERPKLFAVAQSAVGVSDLLRMEFTPNGPPNVAELGTIKSPVQFREMLKVSPYHRVKDGTSYPAVLLTTGLQDPRVEPWMSGKMAARLQAATQSGKPVILRVDELGGHGIGATKQQTISELTDVFAFFLWQMGEPGLQP